MVRGSIYATGYARALTLTLQRGRIGSTYNVRGQAERRNIDVVDAICRIMDRVRQLPNNASHLELINFVPDRPGHDFR